MILCSDFGLGSFRMEVLMDLHNYAETLPSINMKKLCLEDKLAEKMCIMTGRPHQAWNKNKLHKYEYDLYY